MAFFEFNIALSGLHASQRGLSVTSNNISNANTKGYSRQVLSQKASAPITGLGVGMTGTGVTTIGVNRQRNMYLDKELWTQNAKLGEYNVKVTQNALMEAVYGEPSDAGYTKAYSSLFTSIKNLATDPSSDDAKIALRSQIINFTNYYNGISESLKKYRNDVNTEIKASVDEINNLTQQIQSLNEQIFQAELHGDEASTFRDDRDLCIDRLSQLINVSVEEKEVAVKGAVYTKYVVKADGHTLVDHLDADQLTLKADDDGFFQIGWASGFTFNKSSTSMSGELKGLIDIRDGSGSTGGDTGVTYNGIPYYINAMDQYVRTFAQTMNEEYSKDDNGNILVSKLYDGNGNEVTGSNISYVKKDSVGNTEYYNSTGQKIYYTATDATGNEKHYKYNSTSGAYEEVTNDADKYSYTTKYVMFTYVLDGSDKGIDAAELKDYSKMTAANFAIAGNLYLDASSFRSCYNESEGDRSDNKLWNSIAMQQDNTDMFKQGSASDYMISIFDQLGLYSSEAQYYQSTQEAVATTINNQRLSVSQVETNEEFVYLIKYQQAYQAAAKVLNTIDGIYNTTIFNLGNF